MYHMHITLCTEASHFFLVEKIFQMYFILELENHNEPGVMCKRESVKARVKDDSRHNKNANVLKELATHIFVILLNFYLQVMKKKREEICIFNAFFSCAVNHLGILLPPASMST